MCSSMVEFAQTIESEELNIMYPRIGNPPVSVGERQVTRIESREYLLEIGAGDTSGTAVTRIRKCKE